MESIKEKIVDEINRNRETLVDISNYIFDNPEIGFQEYKAMEILTTLLEKTGFKVERGICGVDTAFKATFENLQGGPVIGLLCEYDALENFGHGCAHHLQGPSIVGAAAAIKSVVADYPYRLEVIGTPAEESMVGGKNIMLKTGAFDALDVALMMHGSVNTQTDIKSLALSELVVRFYGKAAHTAIAPESGRSALEGLLMTFNGISYLKMHVRDDVRIHGIITKGGEAVNIVPEEAEARIEVRANDRSYLDTVIERLTKVVQGAALATETSFELERTIDMDNKIPVMALNNLLMENASLASAEKLAPHRERTGSTDFASVMYKVPGSCIRVAFAPDNTSSHSQEWLNAGKSKEAHDAVIVGARILAMTAYDLISNKELLIGIKEEFRIRKLQE